MTEPVSIWHGEVKVVLDGRSKPVSRLIRQLVWSQQPVEQAEMIADFATVTGRKRKNVNDLLSALRKAMGDESGRLQTLEMAPDGSYYEAARYRLDTNGVDLDIHAYQTTAEAAKDAIGPYLEDLHEAPERVPADFDKDLDVWLETLNAYPVNPGLDSTVFPRAASAYTRFADFRSRLIEAITVALASRFLRDHDEMWLSQAQSHLDKIAGDLSDDVWALRFRLTGSMDHWEVALNDLVAEYEKHSGEPVAGDLRTLLKRIRDRDASVLLIRPTVEKSGRASTVGRSTPHEKPSALSNNDSASNRALGGTAGVVNDQGGVGHPFGDALDGLGVAEAKALHLKDARLSPVECSRRVIRRLWFSGVMANKWVEIEDRDGEHPYEEFDNLLARLDAESDGETLVRLMIVNPWGPKATILRHRGMLTDVEMTSVPILQDLVKRHPSFEVRMYDTMPLFRMIIVDDQFVTVGPYLNRPEVLPNRGWEVPQLVLSPRAEFPMSQAFVGMFEEAWHRNKDNPLPFAQ